MLDSLVQTPPNDAERRKGVRLWAKSSHALGESGSTNLNLFCSVMGQIEMSFAFVPPRYLTMQFGVCSAAKGTQSRERIADSSQVRI